jgi:hypothetical protein
VTQVKTKRTSARKVGVSHELRDRQKIRKPSVTRTATPIEIRTWNLLVGSQLAKFQSITSDMKRTMTSSLFLASLISFALYKDDMHTESQEFRHVADSDVLTLSEHHHLFPHTSLNIHHTGNIVKQNLQNFVIVIMLSCLRKSLNFDFNFIYNVISLSWGSRFVRPMTWRAMLMGA